MASSKRYAVAYKLQLNFMRINAHTHTTHQTEIKFAYFKSNTRFFSKKNCLKNLDPCRAHMLAHSQ